MRIDLDWRNVSSRREKIVVQILTSAGKNLSSGHAQALRDAAFESCLQSGWD